MQFEAIVFDFDGVLVESVDVKSNAFALLYQEYGENVVNDVVAWHLAHGGVSRFEKFRYFHNEILGIPLSSHEELELGDRFSVLVEDAVVAAPWVEGAKEFIDQYCERVPMYIASGTPENELRRIVARRGVEDRFRGVYGAPAKKHEILNLVASLGNHQHQGMLMVGDAMTDYDGAFAAGVKFIGRVPGGGISPFPPGTEVVEDLNMLAVFC